MSEENVEILRHYLGIWLEGDLKDLGDLSFLDADCLYEDEILPDHVGETYQGHDGFRKAWARAVEPWESITGEVEWIRDAGDSVVSCHSGRVRGKGSGIEATIRYAYVWRFRGEKVLHCKSSGPRGSVVPRCRLPVDSRDWGFRSIRLCGVAVS